MKKDLSFLKENLIAHRGAHNIEENIPENTLLAFKKAIEKNYIIELDVHLSKDGKVVVFHDDNMKRITGIDKQIKEMEYHDIKKLKVQNTKEHIPLLTDVLSLVAGKVPIIIELKYDVKCGLLEEEVIKIIKNYEGKVVLKSFRIATVLYLRKKYPNIITGLLIPNLNNKRYKKIKLLIPILNLVVNPDFISISIKSFPNKTISKIRKEKLVLGWTVKNVKDLPKYKNYCDNLICENLSKTNNSNSKEETWLI